MDLAKIVDEAILQRIKSEPRDYIGASGIGKTCSRAIWYDYHAVEGIELTAQEERTMEIGRRLERMVIDYIIAAGFKVEVATQENDYLLCYDKDLSIFRGHMDGLLYIGESLPVVLEIKTAKAERFEKYAKEEGGVKVWSPVYYAQVQSYMGMRGLNDTLFCVINKNNSDWRMEWVKYDDIFYHELKIKASLIAEYDNPPEKINNSPWYYACQYCKYKIICHSEVKL
jgi:hypothetical protein